jgi:flagellar biosynthesis/type III secretory pathway M-ring protein FliF/YscJ
VTTLHEQHAQRGLRSWSRTRWLVLGAIALAVIAVIVLLAIYSGGGGGSGGGGY